MNPKSSKSQTPTRPLTPEPRPSWSTPGARVDGFTIWQLYNLGVWGLETLVVHVKAKTALSDGGSVRCLYWEGERHCAGSEAV